MTRFLTYSATPAAIAAGVLLLLLQPNAAAAQDAVMQNDFEHKINLYNINGKPIVNTPLDVAGTPFFLEQWKNGSIRLFNDQVFDHIPLKVDLQHQQVHFRKPDNNEYLIDAGAVKQVLLRDSTGPLPVTDTFQCGFPPIDNQNGQNFYLVLAGGKITFLESMRKSIHEEQDGFSGEIKKEFRLYDDYYFFRQGKMERIKKDKAYILNALKDKDSEIGAFLEKRKISFRSIEDIRQLIGYYNALP
ncbi:MAG TPA: hypothetical protein VF939_05355 [Puia sp.]